MKEIEHKITEEQLQALFQGKKLVLDYYGMPRVTLYPPRYGVFVTHEKYLEIERAAHNKSFEEMTNLLRGVRNDDTEQMKV